MKYQPKTVVIDWLNTIWKTNLPYQCKYIACYLRSFMNSQQDIAWPSYARMVAETGLSKATIARYLTILENEKWIVRDRGCKGKNTTYTACFPTSLTQRLVSERDKVVSHRDKGSLRERHELNNRINNEINNKGKSSRSLKKRTTMSPMANLTDTSWADHLIDEN